MLWMKQTRGPYLCYTVESEFLTSHVLEQKPQIIEDIKNPDQDIALDIRKLRHVDSLSIKFLTNIDEQLISKGRRMALVGGDSVVLAQLTQGGHVFKTYASMADFELEFHDINPSLFRSILKLARGGDGVKSLQLQCPLCHCTEVIGVVMDESLYQLQWVPSEIIPLWVPAKEGAERLDHAAYKVSVCPHCFFSSTRIDHFTIRFPEGEVKSILKPEQMTNLTMGGTARKAICAETRETERETYFHPPREHASAYLSWKLHETCQKQFSVDRRYIDAFEIVIANFMMCKFTRNERLINDHLHTALAWLNNLMQNQEHYSTHRLLQAYTYHVSVFLALEKMGEAMRSLADFTTRFQGEPEAQFWLGRAEALLEESKEDLK